jgi:protoheme IX farnesyltransferase
MGLAINSVQASRELSLWESRKRLFSDYVELTKPRVNLMVVLTTAVGFYLGAESVNFLLLLNTLLGTALLASGTAVLNQFVERKADSQMARTASRPVPSGRISPSEALVFGMVLVSVGSFYLLFFSNYLTAILGWFTAAVYLSIYTPLKTRTPVCTLIGAVPGAVPPVMGWVAARGELTIEALLLFGILFCWQFPHFLAIAWMYREDYESGGFKMLPGGEASGDWTGRLILLFALFSLIVSLLPARFGVAGNIYLLGALALGVMFVTAGFRVLTSLSRPAARGLLRTSVLYLPLLLVLMAVDKL